MSVNTPHHGLRDGIRNDVAADRPAETKAAFRTTEFVVYVVFLADKAWFYVTLLTVGYMISRGLAKAGSRARRDA